jgi:hypothetical protein
MRGNILTTCCPDVRGGGGKMVELATFPTLRALKARLSDEGLACPPSAAIVIARELCRSLEQCFEHGLCPQVLSLETISVSSRGEVLVWPGATHARTEREAVVAMANALTVFGSPSPVLDPVVRALLHDEILSFAAARERIEVAADRLPFPTGSAALVRLVEYLSLQQPRSMLAGLPLFDRAPRVHDRHVVVIEAGRADRKLSLRSDEADPSAWLVPVVPQRLRYLPSAERLRTGSAPQITYER